MWVPEQVNRATTVSPSATNSTIWPTRSLPRAIASPPELIGQISYYDRSIADSGPPATWKVTAFLNAFKQMQ